MAQAQKHWIQALLHEDPWIPFEVTYDVTAWSNPLLMNLRGGWTSEAVSAGSVTLVPPVAAPAGADPAGRRAPTSGSSRSPTARAGSRRPARPATCSATCGTCRSRDVTAADITAGLAGIDVLVMPDGYANYGVQALGAKGKKALRDWVNAGGRIVAWQGGVEVAVKAGVSTVKLGSSRTDAPGTLIRVSLDGGEPAGDGHRRRATGSCTRTTGRCSRASARRSRRSRRPGRRTTRRPVWRSGVDGLAGIVRRRRRGASAAAGSWPSRVDPNFRAWTQGTQRLLWNAIVGPDPAGATPSRPRRLEGSGPPPRRRPRDAADGLPDVGSAIRIRVASTDATATAKVLGAHGARWSGRTSAPRRCSSSPTRRTSRTTSTRRSR